MATVQPGRSFQRTSAVPLGACFGARGFARRIGQKSCHQLERIGVQGSGYPDEFHDVEPPLAAHIFGHKGLHFFQANGKGALVRPAAFRAHHQLAKCGLVVGMDGFADSAGD